MGNILINIKTIGEQDLEQSLKGLDKAFQNFEKSTDSVTRATRKSAEELQNVADLNNRIAKIRTEQSKSLISATQAEINVSKAKISSIQKEIEILQKQNATAVQVSNANKKLASEKAKLTGIEAKLIKEQEKSAQTAERQVAAAQKRTQAEQRAAIQAQKSTTIAKAQTAQLNNQITAEQAAIAIAGAKVKAIRQEIALLKQQNAGQAKVAKESEKLAKAQLDLKKAQDRYIKSTKAVDKANDDLKKGFKGIVPEVKNLGSSLTAGIAAGATVAGIQAITKAIGELGNQVKVSVGEFGDLDQALTTFRALGNLDENAPAFKAVADEVERLGGATIFTAAEVGNLGVSLKRAGFTDGEVEQSLEGVAVAAIATNGEIEETGKALASVGNVFEIERTTQGFQRLQDVVTTALNSFPIETADEFSEAVKNVGPIAKTAGLELEETAAFLGLFAKAELRGAQGGNALSGTLNRLLPAIESLRTGQEAATTSGRRLTDILSQLGFSYEDFVDETGGVDAEKTLLAISQGFQQIENPTERSALAVAAFGDEYGKRLLALINQTPEAIQDAVGAFNDIEGTAKETADTIQSSLPNQFRLLSSAISGFRTQVGKSLAPVLEPLIAEISTFFQNLTQSFQTSGIFEGITNVLNNIIGTFNEALNELDFGVFQAFGAFIGDVFTNAVNVFNRSGILNAVAELGNAFGEVGVIFTETFGPELENNTNLIAGALVSVIKGLTGIIRLGKDLGLFTLLFKGLTVLTNALAQTAGILGKVIDFVTSGFNALGATAQRVYAIIEPILSGIGALLQPIGVGFRFIGDVIGSFVGPAVDDLGQKFQDFGDAVNGILNAVQPLAEEFGSILEGLGENLTNQFENTLENVRDVINEIINVANKLPGVEIPQIEISTDVDNKIDTKLTEEAIKGSFENLDKGIKKENEKVSEEANKDVEVNKKFGDVKTLANIEETGNELEDKLKEINGNLQEQNIETQKSLNVGEIDTAEAALRNADAQVTAAEQELEALRGKVGEKEDLAVREQQIEDLRAEGVSEEIIAQAEEELQTLKDAGVTKEDLAAAELKVEEAKATKLKAIRDQELNDLNANIKAQELAIQKQLNSDEITDAQAETGLAKLAEERAKEELEILKASNADKSEIIDAEIAIEEARASRIAAVREEALAEIELIEQQAQIDIARLELSGLATSDRIEKLKVNAAVENAKKRIEVLEENNATETELNQATLQLLAAEKEAQEALFDVIEERTDQLEQLTNTSTEALVRSIELQNEADQLRSNALDRQITVLQSINNLEASRVELTDAIANAQISNLSRAETALQILEDENASVEEQAAARAELANLGISEQTTLTDLVKQRQAIEDKAATDRLSAQQEEFSRARLQRDLENQRNIATAKRAITEARIAEIQAQQAALQAQIDESRNQQLIDQLQNQLQNAINEGDQEAAAGLQTRLAELQLQSQLNQKVQEQAQLAAQGTTEAEKGLILAQEQAKQQQEALINQQKAAVVQANQVENARRLDAATERVLAGQERGQVELLPIEGQLLNLDLDSEAAGDLENITKKIDAEAEKLNSNTQDRLALNDIEITQQERLLQLESARADIKNNSGGNTAIPAFKKGGSFAGVNTALVGEAGPELVDFSGRKGFVYNATKTINIIKNLQKGSRKYRGEDINNTLNALNRLNISHYNTGKLPSVNILQQPTSQLGRGLNHQQLAVMGGNIGSVVGNKSSDKYLKKQLDQLGKKIDKQRPIKVEQHNNTQLRELSQSEHADNMRRNNDALIGHFNKVINGL